MSTPRILLAIVLLAGALATVACLPLWAQDVDPRVLQAEQRRIGAVEKVKPSVVAIFARGGQGGGSGVLISDDGYALTNFHVVAPAGPVMKCGLPDGIFYDAVLVGLDKVGDVALIKLLPRKPGDKFPFAKLGDSDKLKAGDWSLAMGNPFLLATDFTPTVTFGMISGVNRYQYPEGRGLLEYTDCIQIDTSINPGNSGGPLFNLDGELIGINGRGSFDKRGRVNSGVGYAISINQIKNFMGHLRAGLDSDHASLGARIEERSEEEAGGASMVVTSILESSDAYRRGLGLGDELVSFGGRPLANANQFKNVLGVYPRGWRMPLVYRHENEKRESEKRQTLVPLMGAVRQEVNDPNMPPGKPPAPGKPPVKPAPVVDSPATKFYEAKAGYANFYFNKLERDRLLAAFAKQGDFTKLPLPWTIEADGEVKKERTWIKYIVKEDKEAETKKIDLELSLGITTFRLEPLKKQDVARLHDPKDSGGLVVALYHWWQLLTIGQKGFEGEFSHGGNEPFYPLPADGKVADFSTLRVDCEVLRTEHIGVGAKWFFSLKDQTLVGAEIKIGRDDDPCELYFSDYKAVDGRMLPHKIEVRYSNDRYGLFTVKGYSFGK